MNDFQTQSVIKECLNNNTINKSSHNPQLSMYHKSIASHVTITIKKKE